MARYQQDRFATAARAFVDAGFGDTSATDTGAIRERCNGLADTLSAAPRGDGSADDATVKALRDVAAMRASIARRFITLSVKPLLAPAPKKGKGKKAVTEPTVTEAPDPTVCRASIGGGTPRSATAKVAPLAFCALAKGHAGRHSRVAK